MHLPLLLAGQRKKTRHPPDFGSHPTPTSSSTHSVQSWIRRLPRLSEVGPTCYLHANATRQLRTDVHCVRREQATFCVCGCALLYRKRREARETQEKWQEK